MQRWIPLTLIFTGLAWVVLLLVSTVIYIQWSSHGLGVSFRSGLAGVVFT